MNYTAGIIAKVIHSSDSTLAHPDAIISYIALDTRRIQHAEGVIFFALSGSIHDGHDFIPDAIEKGVKNIVVEKTSYLFPTGINVFMVENILDALQNLAAFHRQNFPALEVIAVTGSNGKTTIKEWLYQMTKDRKVVKNPKSYNSQIGVPLSVWQIEEDDQLGIFEAGISRINEMVRLERIIQPTIGVFTNIGDAHSEGFEDMVTKIKEKAALFTHIDQLIFEVMDGAEINNDTSQNLSQNDEEALKNKQLLSTYILENFDQSKLISWGKSKQASLFSILKVEKTKSKSSLTILYDGSENTISLPFTDDASIQNVCHCIAVMLTLGMTLAYISTAVLKLQNIPMRLEMKNGINDSLLINDTYNADLSSFKVALDFMNQQSGNKHKMIIFSDFVETGIPPDELNRQMAALINASGVEYVTAIGTIVKNTDTYLDPFIYFDTYLTTSDYLKSVKRKSIKNRAILIKGARVFEMEKITNFLSDKNHTSVLEIDLHAVESNLSYFYRQLSGDTQVIAVIKASAYGSGSSELAQLLEFRKVGYLAVAFIDEGIELRKSGIKMPIMVLNPDETGVTDMLQYDLEPEVYGIDQLDYIIEAVNIQDSKQLKIHLKIDTGMHRLGFLADELDMVIQRLNETKSVVIKTIFTHLSSSEDPNDDDFTHLQARIFDTCYQTIIAQIGYAPSRHILNTAGIVRFPEYHYDYVRLGLGLYGIDSTHTIVEHLVKAHTLKAKVIQIKSVAKGSSIGYNRKGYLPDGGKVAIVSIGYADGLMRNLSNGNYSLMINSELYPIIGNICMDLTIVDISNAAGINVGDDVIIFNEDMPIENLAIAASTIPYEILSRISSRVRRLYIHA